MANDLEDLSKSDLISRVLLAEENMKQAAMYGNDLLKQVSSLKEEREKLAAQLSAQEQTVHELRGNLEVRAAVEASWRDEVDILHTELTKVKEDGETYREEIRRLENQVKTTTQKEHQKYEKAEMELETLRTQSEEMIALLNSQISEIQDRKRDSGLNCSDSFGNAALTVELAEVRQEKESVLLQLQECRTKERHLTDTLNESQVRLQELKDIVSSKEEQICFLKDQLECLQGERASLSADLEIARAGGAGDAGRGNSLFSELEDRRVRAEHQLVLQREKYRDLEQRYMDKLREIQEFKDNFVSRLAAGRRGANAAAESQVQELSARVVELESQLSAFRSERDRNQRRQEVELRQQIELESAFASPPLLPPPTGPASNVSHEAIPGARHYEAVLRAKEHQITELNNSVQQQLRELAHLREGRRTALANSARMEQELQESESLKLKLKFQISNMKEEIDLLRSEEKSCTSQSRRSTGMNSVDHHRRSRGSYYPISSNPKLFEEQRSVEAGVHKTTCSSSKSTKCHDSIIASDESSKSVLETSESRKSLPGKTLVLRTVNFDSPVQQQAKKNVKVPPPPTHSSEADAQDENCKQM